MNAIIAHPIAVLLVEDSPTDAYLVKDALEGTSLFRLTHVTRLDAAIDWLAGNAADVVLLDLGLPGSAGQATLKTLRRFAPAVPVIVLTSLDDDETAVMSAREGAQEFLSKSRLDGGTLKRTVRHVFERERVETALRESERRLATIVGTAPQCIAVIDCDGTVLSMNDAGLAMIQAKRAEEVVGRSAYALVAPEYRDAYRVFHESVCRGRNESREFDIIGLRGTRRSVETAAAPLRDGSGVTRHLAITQDVTARKIAERDLRLRDRAIHAVSQGIVIADVSLPDQPIVFVSPGFERMTGYSAAEVVGKNCRFLQGAGTDPAATGSIREAVASGRPCEVELLNYRKDGTPFWNAVSIAPISEEAGPARYFVGVQTDITDRRRLEDQLRQSQKMEAVGQLAGGVAHDFNNLLTIIIGCNENLQSEERMSEAGLELIQEIKGAAERAAALTRQLLAYSRKQHLELAVVDVNDVVDGVGRLIERLIGEDVEFHKALAPDLWPVRIDRGQLEQVLVNLCVNARDAMPAGGRLTIETANIERAAGGGAGDRPAGRYVKVAVTDDGTGMSDEIKSRIFDPFFTTKEVGKGTGLGLSVVYGIVKQSGGDIEVETRVGAGPSMVLHFPAAEGSEAAGKPEPGVVPVGRDRGTVLLVEDDDGVRQIARRALEKHGYVVLEAEDGKSALAAAARAGAVDLVLTDVVMPEMGGRQLVESLLRESPRTKVLYMSGYIADELLRHGIDQSSHAFLRKPFTAAELVRKVRGVLGGEA